VSRRVHVVRRSGGVAAAPLAAFLRRAARELRSPRARGEFSVALVSDREIAGLNRRFRGLAKPTDVLAFPASVDDPYLGDIAVAVPTARRQAAERGHSVAREVKILALHGWLHLLGYDHETDDGAMMRLQQRLLRKLLGGRAGGSR
jgi:probable rRNA maturation factor